MFTCANLRRPYEKKYKARCEFLKDALAIMEKAKGLSRCKLTTYKDFQGLDCALEFDSDLDLAGVIKTIKSCEDVNKGIELHVPMEAVNYKKLYTGERRIS